MKRSRSGIREFDPRPGRAAILKFLIGCLAFISGALSLIGVRHIATHPDLPVRVITLLPIPIFVLAILALRVRHSRIERVIAGLIVGLFYVLGFVTLFRWGFDVPEGLLSITLGGIMTALLYEGFFVWIIYLLVGIVFSLIAGLQTSGMLSVRVNWRVEVYSYGDIAIYAVTMAIIFAVTWLFNRQLHAAYLRSRASEKALREQSEHLEELVLQRTESLRQEHLQRVTDLHRFVLYGKEATGLLHDILNPLTALSLQISSLKKKKENQEQVLQAEATLQRLEQLVTGARRHMRKETEPEVFSLRHEVEAVFQAVQHRAREHGITLRFAGEDCELYTDPILIYKICQNITANALDACAAVPAQQSEIVVTCIRNRTGVTLTFSDTGCGMNKAQSARAFEPYYTTKKRDEGAGIGLSLTKELVEELGGTIQLTSQLHKGTTVTIHLPSHVLAHH